jgi:opacity protein-like surface antigen
MNQLRAVFAVGAALLLAVLCGPLASPGAYAQGAQPTAPPPGKALLQIVRRDTEPREALVPVIVNTELVGYLENGGFTSVAVNPGRVFVRTGEQVIGSFELEAAADRTYYLRVQAVHGTTVVQTDITQLDDAQGRDAVAQARFVPPAPPAPPEQRKTTPGPDLTPAPTTIRQPVYFRLDAGYSMSTGTDLKDANANTGIICGDPACTSPGKLKDVGGGPVLSLGVGYFFSESLRGDITFGYRFSRLNSNDASVPATNFKADVSSLTAMANGYIDFGSSGIRPYLGLGLGISRNRVGAIDFDDGAGFAGNVPGGSKTDFAAAFMAGVGIPMEGWMLDIGYRYISMGKIKTDFDPVSGYEGATGKLMAHELTLGMRF